MVLTKQQADESTKPDPVKNPRSFLRQFPLRDGVDDVEDVSKSIKNRYELIRAHIGNASGGVPDRMKRVTDTLQLMVETLDLSLAYREIVRQKDSP